MENYDEVEYSVPPLRHAVFRTDNRFFRERWCQNGRIPQELHRRLGACAYTAI
jgi:hypothetical protein